MPIKFDTGYEKQPFRGLCESYPDETVYKPQDFRTEWGPIFHRGRLDGSPRVLVIGPDPAEHEAIARRILVGVAGHRVQGFLAKLGIDRSYVMLNTFLYSVYGSGGSRRKNDPDIIAYRNAWLDALLVGQRVEAVVALGGLADDAWTKWRTTAAGAALRVAYARITHPTAPSRAANKALAITQMLANWNTGLQALRPAIAHPDANRPLVPYETAFQPAEFVEIPVADLPPRLPIWMREAKEWADRSGGTPALKRARIVVTVPQGRRN
jgi:uracil-DNA glycosylase